MSREHMKIIFDFNQKCFFVNAYRLRTNSYANGHGYGANNNSNGRCVCLYVCLLVRWHGFLAVQARSQLCWQLYCVDKCTQFHKRAPTISVIQKSTHFNVKKIKKQRGTGKKMRCFYRHHGFSHFLRAEKYIYTQSAQGPHALPFYIFDMRNVYKNPKQQKSPLVSSLQIATA